MAGRSELPSGNPSSFRRTELRLGEPEPPAKKRIIDVAVLVEPCQLARVSGYRAMCAARCRPPSSLVKVVLARYGRPSRAAFPVAGAKADAGWNAFLWPLGRARSAAETRAAQRSSLPLSIGAEKHTQRSAWDFAISQCCFLPSLCCRLRSGLAHAGAFPALGDRSEGCREACRRKKNETKPAEPFFERPAQF